MQTGITNSEAAVNGDPLSASRGKGQGDGYETSYTKTHVSGVSVNTGGNLHIQSLQDSASYKERSISVCGSITVGEGKTKIDSDYLSVTDQSGIRAGDGGFQFAVGNRKNSFIAGCT